MVYSTTISSRCRGMNPWATTQVSMQRNIRLFLSQPCSFVRMTWPITAMLQGAVLLQTSHAWAIRPQFAQACIWQMCRARQLSSQCRAQQYGPDTLTSSFIWPRSVIGPLRLGCPSTCLANQETRQAHLHCPSLTHYLSALLSADPGVDQLIQYGAHSIQSNHRLTGTAATAVQELQANVNKCDQPTSDASKRTALLD